MNARKTKPMVVGDENANVSIVVDGETIDKARPVHSYLPSGNVFTLFGAVSVAPHGVEHVLVYVRGASPFTQAESRQSQ